MKYESCFSSFDLKLKKSTFLHFKFWKTYGDVNWRKKIEITEFVVLLSIPKGSVNMKSLEKSEIRVLLWYYWLKIQIEYTTPSERSIKEISVRYADILTLLSILKGTVNIN